MKVLPLNYAICDGYGNIPPQVWIVKAHALDPSLSLV